MMQSFWADEGEWPRLKRSFCPYCADITLGPALVKMHDDEARLRCSACGKQHSRKEGDPESYLTYGPDFHFLREPLPKTFDEEH